MEIPRQGTLLRIFVGEADHWHGKPLYEELVNEARAAGLAGAASVMAWVRAARTWGE